MKIQEQQGKELLQNFIQTHQETLPPDIIGVLREIATLQEQFRERIVSVDTSEEGIWPAILDSGNILADIIRRITKVPDLEIVVQENSLILKIREGMGIRIRLLITAPNSFFLIYKMDSGRLVVKNDLKTRVNRGTDIQTEGLDRTFNQKTMRSHYHNDMAIAESPEGQTPAELIRKLFVKKLEQAGKKILTKKAATSPPSTPQSHPSAQRPSQTPYSDSRSPSSPPEPQ